MHIWTKTPRGGECYFYNFQILPIILLKFINVFAHLEDYRYKEGELRCFYRANKFWPVKDKKESWGIFLRWIGTQLLMEFFNLRWD